MRIAFVISLLGLAALATGCAAPERASRQDPRSGQVGFAEVDSAVVPANRLSLADNESFQPPLPRADNAAPAYPPELLERHLPPQSVCVRLSIDEGGSVFDAAPVDQGPECALGMDVESAFFAAAAKAAMGWRFEPAFRCVFQEGTPADAGCGLDGTVEIPQPVSLVYRFVFEQVDGKGTVSIR